VLRVVAAVQRAPVGFQEWIATGFACFSLDRARSMVGDAMASTPLHFLILLVANWLRRHQTEALE
jgi:hypothetical protein